MLDAEILLHLAWRCRRTGSRRCRGSAGSRAPAAMHGGEAGDRRRRRAASPAAPAPCSSVRAAQRLIVGHRVTLLSGTWSDRTVGVRRVRRWAASASQPSGDGLAQGEGLRRRRRRRRITVSASRSLAAVVGLEPDVRRWCPGTRPSHDAGRHGARRPAGAEAHPVGAHRDLAASGRSMTLWPPMKRATKAVAGRSNTSRGVAGLLDAPAVHHHHEVGRAPSPRPGCG